MMGDLETRQVQTVFHSVDPAVFHVSGDGSNLYWMSRLTGMIYKQDLFSDEGPAPLFSIPFPESVRHIEVDHTDNAIYWRGYGHDGFFGLFKAGLDGTDLTVLADLTPASLSFIISRMHLFYVLQFEGAYFLHRSDLSGENLETIYTSTLPLEVVRYSESDGALYVRMPTDGRAGLFRLYPADGTTEFLLYLPNQGPIDIDLMSRTLVHAEGETLILTNLDSFASQEMIVGSVITSLRAMQDGNSVIWQYGHSEVHSLMNTDFDRGYTNEVVRGLVNIQGLAASTRYGELYMTGGSGQVLKADPGLGVIDVLAQSYCGIGGPGTAYFSEELGTLFWGFACITGPGFARVGRDGSQYEYYSAGGYRANAIAVDPLEGNIYWAGWSEAGQSSAVLVAPLASPTSENTYILMHDGAIGIGLDTRLRKLFLQRYNHDRSETMILRSSFDGTDVDTLIQGLGRTMSLSMDVVGDRLYWIDRDAGTIMRARLDGTDFEVVFSGLNEPGSLALSFSNTGSPVSTPRQEERPSGIGLHHNYPNPFNPSTVIRFGLPAAMHVQLRVFDLMGREVALLLDAGRSSGIHDVVFDAGMLSGGVYIVELYAGGMRSTRKIMLLK